MPVSDINWPGNDYGGVSEQRSYLVVDVVRTDKHNGLFFGMKRKQPQK